jgi:hypothetical protein
MSMLPEEKAEHDKIKCERYLKSIGRYHCLVCSKPNDLTSVRCIECYSCTHTKCLLDMQRIKIMEEFGMDLKDPSSLVLKLFNQQVYEQYSQMQEMVAQNAGEGTNIDENYKKMYKLTNTDQVAFPQCYECRSAFTAFGKKPIFQRIDKYLRYIRVGCILVPVAAVGVGLGISCVASISGSLVLSLRWVDDLFTRMDSIQWRDLSSFLLVPHSVFSMASTNVGLLNLAASCALSWFSLGIPVTGVTRIAQNLLHIKLFSTLAYRLTLNCYYFNSFKITPPAFFNNKLGVKDALSTQNYQNQYGTDDDTSFTDRVKGWFRAAWSSLQLDFGVLYKNTTWDVIQSIDIGLIPLAVGTFCQLIPQLTNDPFLSDSQNAAYATLIGIGAYQVAYFLYSNYYGVLSAKSLNNMTVGGEVDKKVMDYLWNGYYKLLQPR